MIVLLQRVLSASVTVDGETLAAIERGLLAFVGLEKGDTPEIWRKMAQKIIHYRLFSDDQDKMNLSVQALGGEILLVSQFTLAAHTDKGRRPSFDPAMPPNEARPAFADFVAEVQKNHPKTQTGRFGADMKVRLINDGPVTFYLRDSRDKSSAPFEC